MLFIPLSASPFLSMFLCITVFTIYMGILSLTVVRSLPMSLLGCFLFSALLLCSFSFTLKVSSTVLFIGFPVSSLLQCHYFFYRFFHCVVTCASVASPHCFPDVFCRIYFTVSYVLCLLLSHLLCSPMCPYCTFSNASFLFFSQCVHIALLPIAPYCAFPYVFLLYFF